MFNFIQRRILINFVCRWNCLIQLCPFHLKVSICLPFCLNPLLFVSARSFTCHQPYPVLFVSTACFRFNPVFLSLFFFLFRFNPLLSSQHCPFVSTLYFGLKTLSPFWLQPVPFVSTRSFSLKLFPFQCYPFASTLSMSIQFFPGHLFISTLGGRAAGCFLGWEIAGRTRLSMWKIHGEATDS